MSTESEAPTEGVVMIRKNVWEFGHIGANVEGSKFRIVRRDGGKSLVRDVKDAEQWREGWETLPEVDAPPAASTEPKAPKAPKTPKVKDANEIVHYATGDAKRGGNTFPADAATHVCTGACGKKLAAVKFPTGAPGRRVSECRTCRDARRKTDA